MPMFSTTSEYSADPFKDSGIGISSVSMDGNDIDLTSSTNTTSAKSIHTNNDMDA